MSALRSFLLSLVAFAALFAMNAKGAVLECPNTIRISVLLDGSILLDGTKVTLGALDARLEELSKTNGVVWYYREQGRDASAVQETARRSVLDLVIKHRRPISLSSKPDFSDVVDGDGNASPRTQC